VKLYIQEQGSERVDKETAQADLIATSLIAYPETLSAFSRNLREGLYDRKYYNRMRLAFEKDWQRIHIVDLNREIARSAGDLIHRHGLRGFDAIHLSSALQLQSWLSTKVMFLCFDEKLSKVASAEKLAR
jgi:predicted nucleic acid-binding protein